MEDSGARTARGREEEEEEEEGREYRYYLKWEIF